VTVARASSQYERYLHGSLNFTSDIKLQLQFFDEHLVRNDAGDNLSQINADLF